MEWTVLLCLLCVQVCVLTSTSLQAPHRAALAEEGIHDNKTTEEVLDELWNQVEAVTDAPFPEVEGCQHRPGGCSPLAPNQVFRDKRQTDSKRKRERNAKRPSRNGGFSLLGSSRKKRQEKKRPKNRPGSSSALESLKIDVSDSLEPKLPSQDVSA